MNRRNQEYDDDVFSLEEDLAREHRKQKVQYYVVAICALLVVALAVYGSIMLTQRRLAEEVVRSAAVEPIDEGQAGLIDPVATADPVDTDFWPAEFFPNMPVLESEAYNTTKADAGYADIEVPSSTTRNFDAYITQLTDAGAAVYARTPRLSVLMLDGVEIHLITSNQGNHVVFCKEPAYGWDDATYSAFPLPTTGRLVSVRESGTARELTYRDAATLDALAYANSLVQEGWVISGSLEPSNNIFTAVYKKDSHQITIDYFASSDNYTIKLEL